MTNLKRFITPRQYVFYHLREKFQTSLDTAPPRLSISATVDVGREENLATKKKTMEKALIPLPPAGFVLLIYASTVGVPITAPPKPAVEGGEELAVSRSAVFCKEVQDNGYHQTQDRNGDGLLDAPVYMEMTFENRGLWSFRLFDSLHRMGFELF